MSFFNEENSNSGGDDTHYFDGTEEAQFSTWTSPFFTHEVQ